MLRTQAKDAHQRREGLRMLGAHRQDKRIREGQSATLGSWLDGGVDILTTVETVREMDETDLVGMT